MDNYDCLLGPIVKLTDAEIQAQNDCDRDDKIFMQHADFLLTRMVATRKEAWEQYRFYDKKIEDLQSQINLWSGRVVEIEKLLKQKE